MSKNIKIVCCGYTTSITDVKHDDLFPQKSDNILEDASEQGDVCRTQKKVTSPGQLSLSALKECSSAESSEQASSPQIPFDQARPCLKQVCEPCPPERPTNLELTKTNNLPQKLGLNKILMFLLSFCFPGCNSQSGYPQGTKLMLCLPCPPPHFVPAAAYKREEVGLQVNSFPFAVPQNLEGEAPHTRVGKYLPPPERRQCSSSCIHKSDLKGDRPCTWHDGIPCVAHCFCCSNLLQTVANGVCISAYQVVRIIIQFDLKELAWYNQLLTKLSSSPEKGSTPIKF